MPKEQIKSNKEVNEEKIKDLLIKIGFPKKLASSFAIFFVNNSLTAHEIEQKTGMRQPEVSILLKQLINENFIDYERIKEEKEKGRPHHVYKLKNSLLDTIKNIEDGFSKKTTPSIEAIKELKTIFS